MASVEAVTHDEAVRQRVGTVICLRLDEEDVDLPHNVAPGLVVVELNGHEYKAVALFLEGKRR